MPDTETTPPFRDAKPTTAWRADLFKGTLVVFPWRKSDEPNLGKAPIGDMT